MLLIGGGSGIASPSATVVVLGDSLAAGYGLPEMRVGWVALLEQSFSAHAVRFINAGISGDTTAGGRARLPQLLERYHPEVVILELGGNDGLRGLPLKNMEQNLKAMITEIKASGASPVLLGIQMPAHYGSRFNQRFSEIYSHLADQEKLPHLTNFLEGVGDHPDLMQADGLHPNAGAQPALRDRVEPLLRQVLEERSKAKPIR